MNRLAIDNRKTELLYNSYCFVPKIKNPIANYQESINKECKRLIDNNNYNYIVILQEEYERATKEMVKNTTQKAIYML